MVNALTIKNSLKNLISKNNTSTSANFIGLSLASGSVQTISGGNAEREPVLNINYPAVFVELKAVSDEHIELGNSARRDTELTFDVVSIVQYGPGVDGEDTDNELIRLTHNLQNLFRNYVTLSTTVDRILVQNTEYDISEDETYNAHSRINLMIKKRG